MSDSGRAVVAVAMSGGVDSSVAAALCVEAGYDVFGIMLNLWSESSSGSANRCCSPQSAEDARDVADILGIDFTMIDASAHFKARVVDSFLDDVADGATPNPCFTCNRRVRFGMLLEEITAMGADRLATGHYARIDAPPDGRRRLLRGVDTAKDQSYMLHRLGKEQLARAMFPLGEYTKPEVRTIAESRGLPVASREESTDLCWVADDGVNGFLERHLALHVACQPSGKSSPIALRRGPIEDQRGRVVGEHAGLQYYTIGQRRGLGVALGYPAYVVRRDWARNALVIGPDESLFETTVRAGDWHWIDGRPATGSIRVEAQIRYRAAAAPATLDVDGDSAVAVFDEPQRAPAQGQGLVAYSGDHCLGGGAIVATNTDTDTALDNRG